MSVTLNKLERFSFENLVSLVHYVWERQEPTLVEHFTMHFAFLPALPKMLDEGEKDCQWQTI